MDEQVDWSRPVQVLVTVCDGMVQSIYTNTPEPVVTEIQVFARDGDRLGGLLYLERHMSNLITPLTEETARG